LSAAPNGGFFFTNESPTLDSGKPRIGDQGFTECMTSSYPVREDAGPAHRGIELGTGFSLSGSCAASKFEKLVQKKHPGGHMFSPWRRLAQCIRLAVSGHRVENPPLDRRSIEVLVRVAQLKRNPVLCAGVDLALHH
jgi:hypothetical protein